MSNQQIPKDRYTSKEYLRAEAERLWPQVWQVAGLSCDLTSEGSYFTFDVTSESVLVVRHEGGVRAFHNVCSHRGRRLCDPGRGQAKSFQCPYHGWTYTTGGKLARVTDPDAFPEDLDVEALGLKAVACEEWAGFVWVNLNAQAPSLEEYLGPVRAQIDAYRLGDFALVEDLTLDMPCNWKVCVDAFNEVYHLSSVHPEILGVVDDINVRTELLGIHGKLVVPFYVPSPRLRDRQKVDESLQWMLKEAGVPPLDGATSALDVHKKVRHSIRSRERAGELDCSGLSDEQLSESHHFHVFPNFQIDMYAMKALTLRARPHATDPGRMLVDQQRFDRIPRDISRPPRPAHKGFRYGKGSLGTVTDQDMFNLVRVQRGMSSSGFETLVIGAQEQLIGHLHRGLDTYIAE